jgi:putative glutamine amidotransferase
MTKPPLILVSPAIEKRGTEFHDRSINARRMDKRNAVAHEVRLTDGSILVKITGKQTLGVNSTHHQAVAQPAKPLAMAAYSPDGVVESMQLKPGAAHWLPFLLSVQFHPERLVNGPAGHRAIFSVFTQACVVNRKKTI